jgi:uncharacterized protein YciI
MEVKLTRRQALFYDYVENAIEARAPHRDGHLALVREWKADGRMLDGGAIGDPPHGGLLVFDDAADVEAFTAADPYVANGVVTGWRVEPWMVVG